MKPEKESRTIENQTPLGLGTKMTGVAGAAAGSLLFSLPMFFVIALRGSVLGYILAVLIPFGAVALYKSFRGYRKYSFALVSIIVCIVLYTLQAYLLAQAWSLSRIPEWQEAAAEYDLSSFAYAWESVLTGVNLRIMAPQIIISIAAALAGFMMCTMSLKEYASVTPDEETELLEKEKELADRIMKEQKEKEKEAKKKKPMPKSLKLYGTDDEKVLLGGRYTVCPQAVQRKYLYILGGLGMVLFLSFAVYSVYELVVTGSVKPVFYVAVGIIMAWQALKLILSVSRYIKVDGEKLTCRGSNIKVTTFTMDDIALCEDKGEGRYMLRSSEGEALAFFSTKWENGKKLLKAIEAYRIEIE